MNGLSVEPESACPSDDELVAFSSGKLHERVIEQVAVHVAECSRCESTLESLGDDDITVVDYLREPNRLSALVKEPGFKRFDDIAKAINVATLEACQESGTEVGPLP